MSEDDGLGSADPFQPWESDHTALVHVLWDCKHDGLTLADDFDAVADRIMRSRWMAAERERVTAALRAKAAAADRVRKLADWFDASPNMNSNRFTAARIRRALDGDAPC